MEMLNAEIFRTQEDLKLRVTARIKEKITLKSNIT